VQSWQGGIRVPRGLHRCLPERTSLQAADLSRDFWLKQLDEPLDFSAGINKVDLWSSDQQRETNRQNLNYSNKNCSSYFEAAH